MEKKGRHEPTETLLEKKAWISPEIFDSSVIAVTDGNTEGTNSDQEGYS